MGRPQLPLTVAAAALLALSGCLTAEADKAPQPRKPDVTQPGVLPPPQESMKLASGVAPGAPQGGPVVPAGGAQPAVKSPAPPVATPAPPAPGIAVPSLSKIAARMEKKVPATEMAVAWRNRIAHLPDPTRNGALQPGVVGQMFLYGGPHLQFCDPDGTLTVDLIDETPRTDGKPPATPERWQFSKEMLRNLRTTDETFGKSYVLFLPWPAYRPDITKLKISARYDPDGNNGFTLYSPPTVITIDNSSPFGSPVWDGTNTTFTPSVNGGRPVHPGPIGPPPSGGPPQPLPKLDPIPLGGGGGPTSAVIPAGGAIPLGAATPGTLAAPPLNGAQPASPPKSAATPGTSSLAPTSPVSPAAPGPAVPLAPLAPAAPGAATPAAPAALPPGVPPLVMTIGKP